MFRNLLIVFAAAVILGSGGSSQGTPTNLNVKSPGDDQRPQQVNNIQNQINNWGLGNDDRKMLMEMKYKIDSLHNKSTSRGNSRFICVSILEKVLFVTTKGFRELKSWYESTRKFILILVKVF